MSYSLILLFPPGTLDELGTCIRDYGNRRFTECGRKNPLKFGFFWDRASWAHGGTQFNKPQWILMSNDLLPKSLGESWEKQEQMVKKLNVESLLTYQVPSLREAVLFAFLHMISTGDNVLQGGNEQKWHANFHPRSGNDQWKSFGCWGLFSF